MKRLFIVLIMLFLMYSLFAKTVQCVRSYQVFDFYDSTYNVTPQIQSMINQGWKVVSITPITKSYERSNPTDYVIVVFEREE